MRRIQSLAFIKFWADFMWWAGALAGTIMLVGLLLTAFTDGVYSLDPPLTVNIDAKSPSSAPWGVLETPRGDVALDVSKVQGRLSTRNAPKPTAFAAKAWFLVQIAVWLYTLSLF